MIYPQTMLTVADNTGAKKVMCIRVLGGNKKCKTSFSSIKNSFNIKIRKPWTEKRKFNYKLKSNGKKEYYSI